MSDLMHFIKIYEQARQYIEKDARIKKPGDLLPSEVQYASLLGVSRPTIRKAVTELIEIGLIKRIPGKGLIVSDQSISIKRGKILLGIPFVLGDGFLFKIVMACIDRANELGYDYKIINSFNPAERYHLISQETVEDYVAFVLVAYDSQYDRHLLEYLVENKAKVLLVDNKPDYIDVPVINCNDFKGGYLVGKHLIEKGHRKILYISSTRETQTTKDRLRGFLQSFDDNHLSKDTIICYSAVDVGNPQLPSYFSNGFNVDILRDNKITAICGYSSLPIMALCNILISNGFSFPDDLSVIGYGDYSLISLSNMPITNIETPSEEMGIAVIDCINQATLSKKAIEGITFDPWIDNRNTVLNIRHPESL